MANTRNSEVEATYKTGALKYVGYQTFENQSTFVKVFSL
jgi:hypothetical protein